ncbi:glycosyltransferase [Methylobacterium sp. J-026]|uniref:glycosyltransferase n=1 Tax=Methylobacterium sp. J-026 TaxID=2836624 RepID=UPI001FB9BD88|nr:glycosyltransferase [Methylobacterium sp. J-026]MCJ2134424.1 glycosyltransferase [Methylobacterium sp. J-026]
MSGFDGGGSAEGSRHRSRRQLDQLLETARPDQDPEGLITRYVAFEVARSERHRDFVPDGDLIERMRVLYWYLTESNVYHRLPVPLSRSQIDFLNAPMPLLGLAAEVSIAAYAFITQDFEPGIDLHDVAALRRALYWWAVERAAQICPGGDLITPAQVRVLCAADDSTAARDFALTYFLRTYHASDAALQALDLNSDAGRATLVAIVLLRALEKPHLVRLLPWNTVSPLLHSIERDRSPLLTDLLAVALGQPGSPDSARAEGLSARIRARYGDHGPNARASLRPAPLEGGAGLPFLRDPRFSDGPEAGVAVIGPTRATSGLGQAMRLSLEILESAGRSPAQLDFFPGNPAPIGFTARATPAPRLERPRRINLMHLNAEVVPHAFALLDRRITQDSYNIGYFFWELDTVPESHRLALDLLDEIWVSSEYNRETYARATATPVYNVGMAVEAVADVSPMPRAGLGLPDEAFVFLATFDSFSFVERKNPLGVLKAFQAAFPASAGEPVALVLKTQNRSRIVSAEQLRTWTSIDALAARDPRITILDQTLSYDALIGLKRCSDAYVSLHRSEGWGFGLLEAMQIGLPVIATGYSGNMDFCSPQTAFLVDYTLERPLPTDYVYVERASRWAEPSIDAAATAMRTVYSAPAERQARATAARLRVREDFSVAAIARRYAARLQAIEAAHGLQG